MNKEILIICRGGGDLATGIVHRLFRAGYQVLILETAEPAAIRRQVSFCEAVYEGTATVEGVTAERIYTAKKQAVEEVTYTASGGSGWTINRSLKAGCRGGCDHCQEESGDI